MKNIRKITSAFLALTMALTMASCSSTDSDPDIGASPAVTAVTADDVDRAAAGFSFSESSENKKAASPKTEAPAVTAAPKETAKQEPAVTTAKKTVSVPKVSTGAIITQPPAETAPKTDKSGSTKTGSSSGSTKTDSSSGSTSKTNSSGTSSNTTSVTKDDSSSILGAIKEWIASKLTKKYRDYAFALVKQYAQETAYDIIIGRIDEFVDNEIADFREAHPWIGLGLSASGYETKARNYIHDVFADFFDGLWISQGWRHN